MPILKKKKNYVKEAEDPYFHDEHKLGNGVRISEMERIKSDILERINNQDSLINEIRESIISESDIRRIISEELSKLLNKDDDEKPSLTIISKNNRVEIMDEENKDAAYQRIPFSERMLSADDELKKNYNELKCLALAYGLKSRLSNSGDTFRLHAKTYLKITIAGTFLKIFFALNPEDYLESSIPFSDASLKSMYKDIPLVFKVKSQLSLRRAKQLLADVCKKNNLYPGQVVNKDWASSLSYYEPQLRSKNADTD